MTVSTAVEFCKLVESRLGWTPPAGPAWKRYNAMAKRVRERMQILNQGHVVPLYTWHSMELAVELCARERLPRNPLGVMKHVQRAVDMSRLPEADLDQQIRTAIAYEQLRGDPQGWATRLTRAVGDWRSEVLSEWRESIR